MGVKIVLRGEGVGSPRRGVLKGSARSRSLGTGAIGTGVGTRDGLKATAANGRGRGTHGRGTTRDEDDRQTLSVSKP